MGAGRFFALLAVLAALSAAPAAASTALSQAQAAGPYAALSQGSGVELRDAHNRPISRAALARELRAGASAESEPVASRAARLLAEFLDRMSAPVSAVRGGTAPASHHASIAAASPRSQKARLARGFAGCAAAAPAPRRPAAEAAAPSSVGRAFNLPLRI